MELKKYQDVANWLGRSNDVLKLSKLEALMDNGKYYVTMWGHYSAGKSKLINSILNQDILPVQSRETTATLTYIQYGTFEEAHIFYENGTASVCSIDEVKAIFQNTDEVEDIEAIDHIEIYINNELLKNGLVLVDTPGVNTLIQKHQDLAADAIDQSGKIVYVLGSAPSNVDRNFIQQINRCGIDIIFVRTKCDKFVPEEESAEDALQTEKGEVETYVDGSCVFIPVSNEKGNEWNKNIEQVRTELLKLSQSVSDEMKNAIQSRLSVFAECYMEELEKTCNQIEDTINGNSEKINAEISQCDKEIKSLEITTEQTEKKIEERINKTKASAKRDMEELVSSSVEKFTKAVNNIAYSENASEEIKRKYELALTNAISDMQLIMNGHFDAIVTEEHEIIKKVVGQMNMGAAPSYVEVRKDNSRILEMYRSKLCEVKSELERIIAEKQETSMDAAGLRESFDDSVYESALNELNEELRQIPSGIPLKVAQQQNIQPSSVFKKIGQAADLALLLLPGDVIVSGIKGAVNTTKVAQSLHKMGKVGKVILNTGGAVSKNAKAIDKTRDAVYVIRNVLTKGRYSTKLEKEQAQRVVDATAQKVGDVYDGYREARQSGNVLDMLSVAYWTEKLGANFDKSPKMEVDLIEQENRRELRRRITEQQNHLSEERMNRKREQDLITTKEKELEMQEKEKKLTLERIEAEIQKQEAELVKKSAVEALTHLKKDYKEYLHNNLNMASKMIAEGYYASANQNITLYIASQNTDLINAIEERKNKLEELLDMKEHCDKELREKLRIGQAYLVAFKELV